MNVEGERGEEEDKKNMHLFKSHLICRQIRRTYDLCYFQQVAASKQFL